MINHEELEIKADITEHELYDGVHVYASGTICTYLLEAPWTGWSRTGRLHTVHCGQLAGWSPVH